MQSKAERSSNDRPEQSPLSNAMKRELCRNCWGWRLKSIKLNQSMPCEGFFFLGLGLNVQPLYRWQGRGYVNTIRKGLAAKLIAENPCNPKIKKVKK
jgi:hypothetical protein